MTHEITTLIDRLPLRPRSHRRLDALAALQGTCLVLLECSAFAASTLLLVLGLPLFAFLLATGWDLALLFAQLGNLAEHYRTATPAARLLFAQDCQIAFLVLGGGLFLLRIPGFFRRLERRLAEGNKPHGQ